MPPDDCQADARSAKDNDIGDIRIICWNVNSIKACIRRLNCTNLEELLTTVLRSPDIACFQETKLTTNELDESLACPPSYHAFYSFSRRAKHKAGYSGTVTLVKKNCKLEILDAEDGISGVHTTVDNKERKNDLSNVATPSIGPPNVYDDFFIDKEEMLDIDSEGRCVVTDHGKFVLFNLYCPALTVDSVEEPEKYEERKRFKLCFLNMVSHRSKRIVNSGRNVIICGDLNCSTGNQLDFAWGDEQISNRYKQKEKKSDSTLWLLKMLQENDFTDTFRHLNPTQKKYSCWSMKTNARKNNYGCRIDYFLSSPTNFTKNCVTHSTVLDTIEGSDHAPIELVLSNMNSNNGTVKNDNNYVLPSLCAANHKKFAGQKKMSQYLSSTAPSNIFNDIKSSNKNSSVKNTKTKSKQKSLFDLGVTQSKQNGGTNYTGKRRINNYINSNNKLSRIVKKPRHDDGNNKFLAQTQNEADKVRNLTDVKQKWKSMLNGKNNNAPLCKCGIQAILRISNTNKSKGKRFYVCKNPPGEEGKTDSRCNFFSWATVSGKVVAHR